MPNFVWGGGGGSSHLYQHIPENLVVIFSTL